MRKRKIENLGSSKESFSERQEELFKKAKELSILCDAEVAVIIFSNTDNLYEFSSTSMEHSLTRYDRRNIDLNIEVQQKPNDQPPAAPQVVEIEATIPQKKKARRKNKTPRKHVVTTSKL